MSLKQLHASLPPVGRFAPSPTGRMHAGNIFSALVSWLVVKKGGGEIVLRIEDLDPDRSKACFADQVQRDFELLGLTWDKGPFFQSNRSDVYRHACKALQSKYTVYPCFCTRADLANAAQAPHVGEAFIYPGTCRDLSSEEVNALMTKQVPASWRIKVPQKNITFNDAIYGTQAFSLSDECGDFLLQRKDGTFAYHLAVVCDDAEQGITTVVRGSDLLAATPQQIFLQDALGFPTPEYIHVPLLCSDTNARLSKRNKDASLESLLEHYKTPEFVLGHIAYICGLQEEDSPTTPETLLPSFSLEECKQRWSGHLSLPWRA